jgi:hypothetical protein
VSALSQTTLRFRNAIFCGVLLLAGAFRALAATEDSPAAKLAKPSIFWHDNQWQVFTNGVWVPYSDPRETAASTVSADATEPMVEANLQPAPIEEPYYGGEYYGGIGISGGYYGVPYYKHGRFERDHRQPRRGPGKAGLPEMTIRQPIAGMGAPNTGIGKPNVGIGRPMTGLGKTTIGIGQTTIGIGQPNGIGQTTIGIGRQSGSTGHSGFEGGRR